MAPGSVKKDMTSSYADLQDTGEPKTVTEDVASAMNTILAEVQIPQLSSHDQFRLAHVVECVRLAEQHRRSIDENGCRYLVFFREYINRIGRHALPSDAISWREITWAYHSGSQDILVDLVSNHYNRKMLWVHARESGMFMWMTDMATLVSDC